TGADGTVTSAAASLTVVYPPSTIAGPASLTTNAGATVTFSASAVGAIGPFSFKWYKNGVPLGDGGKVSGANSSALQITNVLKADEGSYSVLIVNNAGSATSGNGVLTVIDPAITSQPASLTQNAGTTAAFSVVAAGTPTLTYQWKKNGTAIATATTS